MHDPVMLREQADTLRDALRRRRVIDTLEVVVARGQTLERERRACITSIEEKKAARNSSSQEVARRKKTNDPVDDLIAQGRAIGEQIAVQETELREVEGALRQVLLEIPNITLPDVPAGDESQNVIVKTWGTPRDAGGMRPHWELMAALGMLDLERAAKVSGSGFAVYRGVGARLVRAMINLFMDTHGREHGYQEIWPPLLVNRTTMTGTGQLPKFEDDAYATRDDDLFLIPTAEVPVTNLYRDEILDGAHLPMAFVAYSKCFRRESGSAGKDTRGILRTHEFDKVELVRYATPEGAPAQLELLTRHAEEMLERLELPYRRKLLAAGDTGFAAAKTYDLEAWAPGVGAWLEVSSCSTFSDFQARRANIRYRPAAGDKPKFVHTLNGSGLALPRTIACLLEHHQQSDGSVAIPDALRPYLGLDRLA